MMRKWIAAVLAGLLLASTGSAQTAVRFRWQPGQVLTYRVEQTTSAVEEVGGKKTESTSKLEHVKRWQVLAVEAAGVATVQMSLMSLRMVVTPPSGEALVFDSSQPDKGTPQMREQLSKFVGPPLVVLRVDGYGRVVEVKECKHGPPSRFENEPPFTVTLPAEAFRAGQTWQRAYQMTLDPPHGAGEKYDAVQTYTCQAADAAAVKIAMTTAVKNPPEAPADRIPLFQLQPEGTVVIDVQAGILRSAHLKIAKELTGHQGEGSSFRFTSTYAEEYVGAK